MLQAAAERRAGAAAGRLEGDNTQEEGRADVSHGRHSGTAGTRAGRGNTGAVQIM